MKLQHAEAVWRLEAGLLTHLRCPPCPRSPSRGRHTRSCRGPPARGRRGGGRSWDKTMHHLDKYLVDNNLNTNPQACLLLVPSTWRWRPQSRAGTTRPCPRCPWPAPAAPKPQDSAYIYFVTYIFWETHNIAQGALYILPPL